MSTEPPRKQIGLRSADRQLILPTIQIPEFRMRRSTPLFAVLVMLACVATGFSSTVDANDPALRPIKWHARTIKISFSISLSSPSTAIKPGSDVLGAVRRAFKHWSTVTGITFIEIPSKLQSISSVTGGDGINLITIAATDENMAIFHTGDSPARTRVFFDTETGQIAEADIVINPTPYSEWGLPLQFSTDGTPGTYDLESALAHEVGHFLGLDHSYLISSTMQPCQPLNGMFGGPAVAQRSLSEADRIAARSLYKSDKQSGSVEGRILNNLDGNNLSSVATHIWIESVATGAVIANTLTDATGGFRIDNLPIGEYRVLAESLDRGILGPMLASDNSSQQSFRSVEISSSVRVTAGTSSTVNYVLVPPQNSSPELSPWFLGTNGELSVVPVSGSAGKKLIVYIAGEGIDQVPSTGISVTSPFFTIDAASLTPHDFGGKVPAISFELMVAPNVLFGDYTIKLQANSGEVTYIPGGITIDPQGYAGAVSREFADDSEFQIADLNLTRTLLQQPARDSVAVWNRLILNLED